MNYYVHMRIQMQKINKFSYTIHKNYIKFLIYKCTKHTQNWHMDEKRETKPVLSIICTGWAKLVSRVHGLTEGCDPRERWPWVVTTWATWGLKCSKNIRSQSITEESRKKKSRTEEKLRINMRNFQKDKIPVSLPFFLQLPKAKSRRGLPGREKAYIHKSSPTPSYVSS